MPLRSMWGKQMNIAEILLLTFLFFPSVSVKDERGADRFSIKGFIIAFLYWFFIVWRR